MSYKLPFLIIPSIILFLHSTALLVSAQENEETANLSELIDLDKNATDEFPVNDTVVSIDVVVSKESEDDADVEAEAEERRQAAEGGALNICEEPPSTDQFLYLFIFTDQCYAYSGSGPRWAAMTDWAFDENEPTRPSTKRISRRDRNSAPTNETTTTIYTCGNGKKLPPFTPIVHILNASWFLHASTTKDEKEKEKTGDDGKNETSPSTNETMAASGNGSSAVEKKEQKVQNKSNPDEDWCMVVNFFSPSCPFSARLAPFYNALPRVFPRLLYIAAVDATESSRLNLIYGVAGTPTVMLFHNGKPVARLDDGEYALQRLVSFVTQRTDLKPLLNVDVENEDLQGPLPSIPIRGIDYYLVLAWAFLIACIFYYGSRSSIAQRIWETVCRNWREMEEEQEDLQAQAVVR